LAAAEEDEGWVRRQELAKAPELLLDRVRVQGPEQEREMVPAERVLRLPM
jgi:hypothetical protein